MCIYLSFSRVPGERLVHWRLKTTAWNGNYSAIRRVLPILRRGPPTTATKQGVVTTLTIPGVVTTLMKATQITLSRQQYLRFLQQLVMNTRTTWLIQTIPTVTTCARYRMLKVTNKGVRVIPATLTHLTTTGPPPPAIPRIPVDCSRAVPSSMANGTMRLGSILLLERKATLTTGSIRMVKRTLKDELTSQIQSGSLTRETSVQGILITKDTIETFLIRVIMLELSSLPISKCSLITVKSKSHRTGLSN